MERRWFEPSFERIHPRDLRAYQWERFSALLHTTWQRNAFYRQRWEEAGFSPEQVRRPEDIPFVPLTTKEDLLADLSAHPPYGSRLQVPPERVVCVSETSGTSGKGREVHPHAREDLEWIYRMEALGFTWVGVQEGTVVMLTWPVTMTAGSTWWSYTFFRMGANFLRVGHLPAEEKVHYLRRYGVEVLICTPSYLTRLEEVARGMGLEPASAFPSLRAIVLVGEGRSLEWARQAQERWGAVVHEQWGCTQGAVAWTCEAGRVRDGAVMHIASHISLVEVVDRETRQPVGPYEEGEIVVTPLHGVAAPLIRFALNDRAVWVPPGACDCGRPFEGLLCGSVSRYDDMMKVKGVNVWPQAVQGVLDRYPEVVEHRGTLFLDPQGREVALLEVETAGSPEPALLRRIAEDLRQVTGVGFEVVAWEGSGPLSARVVSPETGKPRRWRDRRPQGPMPPETARRD